MTPLRHSFGRAMLGLHGFATAARGLCALPRRALPTLGLGLAATGAFANDAALRAFAQNCFSPLMTAAKAQQVLAGDGVRVDFYDLRPFSSGNDISPVVGRPQTPDTDRRCEVAFDGDRTEDAVAAAAAGLNSEGIDTEVEVPAGFDAMAGSTFIGARALNPSRIAIVQVGNRPGPNGVETFVNVERLTPEASEKALQ